MSRTPEPRDVIEALAVALYTTDSAGRITYYNEAAAALWGRRPRLGEEWWCGSAKLFWTDGRPMAHDECPLALTLKTGIEVRGVEAMLERPDGSRSWFLPFPSLMRNAQGEVTGAINMLVDVTERARMENATERLAAIVESSDDAIISKSLEGIIQTWNAGAERVFGYSAEEAIGKPIIMMIPLDRHGEEATILGRIRRGERVDHFETVRRRKDGSLIEISLTVSPVRDASGRIIGASKIARDITERKRAQEQQALLLREMNHRVKNLFAVAASVIALGARSAKSASDLASSVQARLSSLARAHELTLTNRMRDGELHTSTTLDALVRAILQPYDMGQGATKRVSIHGPDIPIAGHTVTNFALLLHEFATNAAKYGALSSAQGTVDVRWEINNGQLSLNWTERGGPPIHEQATGEGFGSLLARLTMSQLAGQIVRDWNPVGLSIRMTLPLEKIRP